MKHTFSYGVAVSLFLATFGANAWGAGEVDATKLAHEASARLFQVEELKALHDWGMEHKIRTWMAGGTATGYLVYQKQKLENEALKSAGKPPRYYEGRFTDHYFDIFRSTQDADIVIDGTEEDAKTLEAFLKSKFDYVQGSKEIWEVRLLKTSRGSGNSEKFPLLGFDFQNQNSDSYSTAMIEITDPPAGENRIRDLFDWKNQRNPKLLSDLAEGKITFYPNARHFETKFARMGVNPEIASAIRVLTKAFQYEADLRPEAEEAIRKIVEAFDPYAEFAKKAVSDISKNGQKLFWHSPDVERAWNILERVGLRKKLITFGKAHGMSDLAVWLDREPLRTLPLGTKGKTAGQLGVEIVAHETDTFLAYENISRARDGKPNVFISREGLDTERAVYGEGFYTKLGREGAVGTGLTVRFRVRPEAREGSDFIIRNKDYVIVRNAAMLEVIDESLNLTPIEFFRMLADNFDDWDLGVYQRLKLKMKLSSMDFSPEEVKEITLRALEQIKVQKAKKHYRGISPFLREWLMSSIPKADSLIEDCMKTFGYRDFEPFFDTHGGPWREISPNFMLNQKAFIDHPLYQKWLERALKVSPTMVADDVLSNPLLFSRSEYSGWVHTALRRAPDSTIHSVLVIPRLFHHPKFTEWVSDALYRRPEKTIEEILSLPGVMALPGYEGWLELALRSNLSEVGKFVLTVPELLTHPKYVSWVGRVLSARPQSILYLGESERFMNHPEFSRWMDEAIRAESATVAYSLLRRPEYLHRAEFPHWVSLALEGDPRYVSGILLGDPGVISHPLYAQWVDQMIRTVPKVMVKEVLSLPAVQANPKFKEWAERVGFDPSAKTGLKKLIEQCRRFVRIK